MTTRTWKKSLAAVALALWLAPAGVRADDDAATTAPAKHALPKAKHGGTVIGMCDGKTSIEVDVAPGHKLDEKKAQQASDALMAAWRKNNPGARWDGDAKLAQVGNVNQAPHGKEQHGIYQSFNARDEQVWRDETEKVIAEGKEIFHDPEKLGGTVGVSCGNCHPDGANTHPETYPKYQVQLQRVALLRDMINWCIENPVKGKPLQDGDPKMRALEAYILSTRKGVPLDYGKH